MSQNLDIQNYNSFQYWRRRLLRRRRRERGRKRRNRRNGERTSKRRFGWSAAVKPVTCSDSRKVSRRFGFEFLVRRRRLRRSLRRRRCRRRRRRHEESRIGDNSPPLSSQDRNGPDEDRSSDVHPRTTVAARNVLRLFCSPGHLSGNHGRKRSGGENDPSLALVKISHLNIWKWNEKF